MVDLSPKTIKLLFEQQIKELTLRTKEDLFDYQFSWDRSGAGWLK